MQPRKPALQSKHHQHKRSTVSGVAEATERDCIPVENIPYFGECSKENKPCKECMDLDASWTNISIGGGTKDNNGVPALVMHGCLLVCNYGGVIIPVTSGQGDAGSQTNFEDFVKYLEGIMAYLNSRKMLCKVFGADPVDLTTGNFTYYKADLKIHGQLPLEFGRSYHSLNLQKGVLGKGWNHNYEISLKWKTSNQVLVITEEGNQVLYREDMAGNLTGIRGGVETLEKQKDQYVYTDKDKLRTYFTKEGKALRQTDPKGNSREFRYNPKGLLAEVQNNSGGHLFYQYNEGNQLIYVSDHTGRKLSLIHS